MTATSGEQIAEVMQLHYARGLSLRAVARKLGLSRETVLTGGAVAFSDAQQAQARSVALLRVDVSPERQLENASDGGPKFRSPADQSLGRPHLVPMIVGSVRWIRDGPPTRTVAPMLRGDALAVVEDLDDGRGGAHLDALVNAQVVHAVVTLVVFDVTIDVHADIVTAVGEFVTQGWQRTQHGAIQLFECRVAAAFQLLERSLVQLIEQFPDCLVSSSRGDDGEAVVLRHIQVRRVDVGLVAVRPLDCTSKLIGGARRWAEAVHARASVVGISGSGGVPHR